MPEENTISPKDRQQFYSDGYLLLSQAVSDSDLAAFKKCLWEVILAALIRYNLPLPDHINSIENRCDEGLILLRNTNPAYPAFVQASISRSPEYYKLCSTTKIIDYIRQLMRSDGSYVPLYLTNNGIIFTNPNDQWNKSFANIELDWHKDTFYTLPKSHFLHIWMPLLHDATEDIDTLQICPGSHKEGVGDQKINPEAPYDHRYTINPAAISRYKPISVEVKLGQALIFDGRMLHASGKNTSSHVRCTLIGVHRTPSDPYFEPLSVSYEYAKRKTPEAYFYEVFKDDSALPLLDEQASSASLE